MALGIECLLTDDAARAAALAQQLDAINRERRDLEAGMREHAEALLAHWVGGGDAPPAISLFDAGFHEGVVGIVAGRLKDRLHRPTFVFARGADGLPKGSGRSIAGFHLRDALDLVAKRAPGTITRFGGHAFAAGLSIDPRELPRFAATFEAVARERLSDRDLRRTHESDGTLARGELSLALGEALRARAWGQGFPAPAFDDVFEVREQRLVGDAHAKLVLARESERFQAIAFRTPAQMPPRIHALFRPEVHSYQGLSNLELVVDYWSPAS
jgi:single-stranded-DNA-specific exonuclease